MIVLTAVLAALAAFALIAIGYFIGIKTGVALYRNSIIVEQTYEETTKCFQYMFDYRDGLLLCQDYNILLMKGRINEGKSLEDLKAEMRELFAYQRAYGDAHRHLIGHLIRSGALLEVSNNT